MTSPAFHEWAAAGFGAELLPVCGPRHDCDSPGKIPHVPGWRKMEITSALLARWARSHRGNVGLRTRRFPAIDVDVEDAALADACERIVLVTLGSTARRTRANTARRLLLYRLEGEPFSKAAVSFSTPGGEPGKVEILADGQQCVVAGGHHTGAAIEWHVGQPSAAGLATIMWQQRDAVLAALRARLAELGCKVEGPPEARWIPRVGVGARPHSQDGEIADLALRRLDPDLPYEEWLRIGMALHSRWPDSEGLARWDAWSSGGEKYPGTRKLEKHWASFRPDGGIGFGTLIVMARRTG